jgi:thymus-specific serine protease
MQMLAIIFSFSFCVLSYAFSNDETGSLIGYGHQRLRSHSSKLLQRKTDISDLKACENTTEYYYADAVLDHFSTANEQVSWAGNGQRYWINNAFWAGKGYPVFVFIGGEGQESCNRLSSRMYMYNLAEQHQALLVNVEHRFYGESYPTVDMSTKNLKYLSADQALADLAQIIGYVKKSLDTEESKVITVGGSYPGNLAAWFRLKYPSVTHGSIASSAPVTAKLNFYEYMEVVGQAIIYFSGQRCYDAFVDAANEVAAKAAEGVGSAGMKALESDFNTCSAITSDLDLGILYSDLMGNVQGTVQYNRESSAMNVTDICTIMTASEDSYAQFVQLSAKFREVNGLTCEDASWKDMVEYLSATGKDPSNAARPWTYQTCNEFGYYQTTDSKNQPFYAWKELNLNFSRTICAAAFDGWTADPKVSSPPPYSSIRLDFD